MVDVEEGGEPRGLPRREGLVAEAAAGALVVVVVVVVVELVAESFEVIGNLMRLKGNFNTVKLLCTYFMPYNLLCENLPNLPNLQPTTYPTYPTCPTCPTRE